MRTMKTNIIKFTIEDKMQFAQDLSSYHQVFRTFWDLSDIYFDQSVKVSDIKWDKEDMKIIISVNPQFWSKANEYDKKFTIMHDLLHIVLNHHGRFYKNIETKSEEEKTNTNIATDIAINEYLTAHFVSRALLSQQVKDNSFFVQNVFDKDEQVPINQSADYYLNRLQKKSQDKQDSKSDKGNKEQEGQNDNSGLASFNGDIQEQEVKDSMADSMSKPIFKDGQGKQVTDPMKAQSIQMKAPETPKDGKSQQQIKDEMSIAGKNLQGKNGLFDLKKTPSKIWQSFITKWMFDKPSFQDVQEQTWTASLRRMQGMLDPNTLPGIREEQKIKDEQKMECWVFLDFSGSVSSYSERIVKACNSIPEKKFVLRTFAFADNCHECKTIKDQNGKSKLVIDGNIGGGTSFQGIDITLKKEVAKNKDKYPKCIIVITDGDYQERNLSSYIDSQYQKRWHFVLTQDRDPYSSIPKESYTHRLSTVEKNMIKSK